MRSAHVSCSAVASGRPSRLADETGSFLIEVIVSAVVLLVMGFGVLQMMDRGSQISGQQKSLAMAGNIAQSEQESLRGQPLAVLSNLRTSTPRTVGGVAYTVASRTDWINDASGTPDCTTTGAPADYLELTTTVSSPTFGTRSPITLKSLLAPPARAFGPTQGSLAIAVNDGAARPVAGLTLSLSGPSTLSDATNDNGCILWGYLAAGSGYTISGSRAGYVQPDGSSTIAAPASVIGDQTSNVSLLYDQAGAVRATFTTQRSASSAPISTAPQKAMVESSHSQFVPTSFPVTADKLDTGDALFPWTDPYTVYAGGCATARPPTANLGTAVVTPGAASGPAAVQLPALNVVVKRGSGFADNAVVKVTSACGTVYTRHTLSDGSGLIDDPGFPYGTLSVCASDGAHYATQSIANVTYPSASAPVTMTIPTSGTTNSGSCP